MELEFIGLVLSAAAEFVDCHGCCEIDRVLGCWLTTSMTVRPASFDDVDEIKNLIALSARELSRGYYSDRQIEAAIAYVFGVDTTLIVDRTYFVAEAEGILHGCGGWSKRRTLFGGDQYASRDSAFSDPGVDAAKIRAFFVHPRYARHGIGHILLERCEAEAKAAGYKSAELMSTLPGVSFYTSCGYISGEPTTFTVGDGVEIEFVPMRKSLWPLRSRRDWLA